jgi:hypothetical protein
MKRGDRREVHKGKNCTNELKNEGMRYENKEYIIFSFNFDG